jgi:diguanylate cyclase (GGDEF)-like protein
MRLTEQQKHWLDLYRVKIEAELAGLDLADPPAFFAGIAELRRKLGGLLDLSDAADVALYEELNLILDRLIAERVTNRLNQLTAEARRDPLTGIGHRGAFEERMHTEIERSRRYECRLALILFDLDRFKQVNDRFGHPIGDLLLIDFARALSQSLRLSDQPFRIGGDEFAAILPETQLENGETIVRRIMNSPLLFKWTTLIGLSWGVANWPSDLPVKTPVLVMGDSTNLVEANLAEADMAEALIRLADQRLYECKNRKRPSN